VSDWKKEEDLMVEDEGVFDLSYVIKPN